MRRSFLTAVAAVLLSLPITLAADFSPAYAAKIIYTAEDASDMTAVPGTAEEAEAEETAETQKEAGAQEAAEKGGADSADADALQKGALAAVQDQQRLEEAVSAQAAEEKAELRRDVVDYALSFVGGRYVWGGNDPHTGADCSGFVKYVMQNAAGVSLCRSSREQATQGRTVSADEMQPGDLLFYGNGRSVNHVAMYIGDGQIVHASTEKTGIKVSRWNYRQPVRIASFIG